MICCTASRHVEGSEALENGYIQGAGDDNEAWSCGLTPELFWQHRQQLMSTAEEDLPEIISGLLVVREVKFSINLAVLLAPTKTIYIGTLGAGSLQGFDGVIICSDRLMSPDTEGVYNPGQVLNLLCGTGKLGSRALRKKLPDVPAFVSSIAVVARKGAPEILVTCPTGKDLSVGVALVLLCLYFDNDCKLQFILILC